MKAPTKSKRKPTASQAEPGRMGDFALLVTKLANNLGPILAVIVSLAIVGIVSAQIAHSDVTVVGIVVIVVVAIVSVLVGRIKNVL